MSGALLPAKALRARELKTVGLRLVCGFFSAYPSGRDLPPWSQCGLGVLGFDKHLNANKEFIV